MESLQGRKLLIADDEPDLREMLREEFESYGATVYEAANGRDALEIFKQNSIDAIISDIRMPGGDGIFLLDSVRAIDSDRTLFMLVTGFSEISVAEAYDRGTDAIFYKPFNPVQLCQALNDVLASRGQKFHRLKERTPTDFKVLISSTSLNAAPGSSTGRPQVANIGRGGICIHTQGPLPKVDEVIYFEVPIDESGTEMISGHGVVRWTRSRDEGKELRGFGVEFIEIDSASYKKVLDLVRAKKSRSFIPST